MVNLVSLFNKVHKRYNMELNSFEEKSYNYINIEKYKVALNIIYEEQNIHNKNWISELDCKKIDLKKTLVCHIVNKENMSINQEFKDYMNSYIKTLNILYIKILSRIDKELGVIINGRVKNAESIYHKLARKMNEEDGTFKINKYLNDLLGIRIIDKEYICNIDLLKSYLDQSKDLYKLRYYYKDDIITGYKGFHIYFQGENKYVFPIELQIWDKENESNNLLLHNLYKKDYTEWPKEYINGGEKPCINI